MAKDKIKALLNEPPQVINLGLELFAQTLKDLNCQVININWVVPAEGDEEINDLLNRLAD